MKIGLDLKILWYPLTGMGRAAYELAKLLPYQGKNHDFFYLFNQRNIKDITGAENVKSIIITNKNFHGKTGVLRRIWAEQVLMARAINRYNLDLLHVPAYCGPVFNKKKLVISIYDLAFLHFPKNLKTGAYYYWKTFLSMNIKRCERIIVCSQATKRDVMKFFRIRTEKIDVIPLGLNTKRFFPLRDENKTREIKQKYKLPENFILFVGTLEPRKNLSLLVKAYGLLPDDLKRRYSLFIIGAKGWKYSSIFQLIKELGLTEKIIFPGRVSDEELRGVYSAATLLAFPSLYEGFGLPVLEAMACHTPVLTSNISSLPEVAGEAAYLVNPLSETEISKGLQKLLESKDLREALKQKGIQRVQEFSWERTTQETLKAYTKCLS